MSWESDRLSWGMAELGGGRSCCTTWPVKACVHDDGGEGGIGASVKRDVQEECAWLHRSGKGGWGSEV